MMDKTNNIDSLFNDDIFEHIKILAKEEKTNVINDIKRLENIQFTEQNEKDDVIGYINDHNRVVQVSLLMDNLGKYLKLSYSIKTDEDTINKSEPYLLRWFVNGRYKICNDTIIVYSIFPILDESLLHKQIFHALLEIWDMDNVINSILK